jgi:hypothetical protein
VSTSHTCRQRCRQGTVSPNKRCQQLAGGGVGQGGGCKTYITSIAPIFPFSFQHTPPSPHPLESTPTCPGCYEGYAIGCVFEAIFTPTRIMNPILRLPVAPHVIPPRPHIARSPVVHPHTFFHISYVDRMSTSRQDDTASTKRGTSGARKRIDSRSNRRRYCLHAHGHTLCRSAALPLCRSAALPLCRSASLPLCLSASLPTHTRAHTHTQCKALVGEQCDVEVVAWSGACQV